MNLAPVILFVYNRPEHTRRTIEALKKNLLASESELFIFSDAAKNAQAEQNVEQVRQYIKTINGFKKVKIILREENFGLAKSIITGVREVIERWVKVIVLEDDLITSPDFLSYMNDCLNSYENNNRIFSVTGYCPPITIPANYRHDVFLFNRIHSWSWATWKSRWEKNDWDVSDFEQFIRSSESRKSFNQCGEDVTIMLLKQMLGKIDSWAIRFNFAAFKNKALTVYPVQSKIQNAGADGSGSHIAKTTKYNTTINKNFSETKLDIEMVVNDEIANSFRKFYQPSLYRRMINYLKIKKHLLNQ